MFFIIFETIVQQQHEEINKQAFLQLYNLIVIKFELDGHI